MITQFSEAVATSPDGIAIMGHPGDAAFGPLVDDAVAQGIIVTVMNTELPETEAKHAAAGTGYAGATNREAGAALATEAIKRGGLQSGDKAFLWGLESQPGRGERTLGIHETLEAAGLEVIYQEIDDATNGDPAAGVPTFTGMASANPDLKAVFLDHGNVTSTAQAYLDAAGLAPDAVYVAGFDLSPATVQAVQGRLRRPRHRPAAVAPGLRGDRTDLPDARTTGSAGCSSTPAAGSSTRRTSTSSRRSWRSRSADGGPRQSVGWRRG